MWKLQRKWEEVRDHLGREDWVIFSAVLVLACCFVGTAVYCWMYQHNVGATVFASVVSLFFGVLDTVFWFVRGARSWQR